MKKSRRMFSLAMLVCLIVGVSTGIRECIGAACALAFVNATALQNNFRKRIRCLKNNTNIRNNGCKESAGQSKNGRRSG